MMIVLAAIAAGTRFRMYDAHVEDEVRAALKDSRQYSSGLIPFPHVVVDRNLVTSRYLLFDAEKYAQKFAEGVEKKVCGEIKHSRVA